VTTNRDRLAISKFTFEMGDASHLSHVLKAVRKVDGVYDAYRITGKGRTDKAVPAAPKTPATGQAGES
jgi:GTP diphosphokinase / guanosine-3',5'-bis(diphosphate) 3'-diphosphatase